MGMRVCRQRERASASRQTQDTGNLSAQPHNTVPIHPHAEAHTQVHTTWRCVPWLRTTAADTAAEPGTIHHVPANTPDATAHTCTHIGTGTRKLAVLTWEKKKTHGK